MMSYDEWYSELFGSANKEGVLYLVEDKDNELLHDAYKDGESPYWVLSDLIMDSIQDC